MTTNELWADIASYPGYQASSLGRIRRWDHRYKRWNVQSQQFHNSSKPYFSVAIGTGKSRSAKLVHRLIAEAFLGPCPQDQEVCHWNDIGTDNRIENIRYGTKHENCEDARRNGGLVTGERCHLATTTENQVREIKRRITFGERNVPIARAVGVSRDVVKFIRNGRAWKNLS